MHPAGTGGLSGSEEQGLSAGNEQVTAKQAHLNRIRENQRRCRKRRKEYLEEMEEKIRQYQLNEVKVSVEMQAAARKVANENRQLLEERGQLLEEKKHDADEKVQLRKENTSLREENMQLRAHLRRHGINDDCIFHTSPSTDSVVAFRHASPATTTPSGSSTTQHLEHLLQAPKLKCIEPCEPFSPQPGHGGSARSAGTDMTLQNREASGHGTSSIWLGSMSDSASASVTPQEGRYHQALNKAGTALSRVDAAMVLKHLGSTSPDVPGSMATSGPVSSTPSTGQLYYNNMHLLPSYTGDLPYYNDRQRLSGESLTRSSTTSCNSYLQGPGTENNCASATNMICVMSGLHPDQVRHELGCPPGNVDCHVDARRINHVASRYVAVTAAGM